MMVEGLGGEGLRVKEYEFVVHFSGSSLPSAAAE